jgi:hypothetical protein
MRNVAGTEHVINAEAYAGASKTSDVGVAGALALNIANHTEALVSVAPTCRRTSGAVTVKAENNGKVTAKGGKQEGGGSVGVGAGVALDIVVPNLTRAEVESGATLSGGTDFTVQADSAYNEVSATSEAGSKGDGPSARRSRSRSSRPTRRRSSERRAARSARPGPF